MRRRPVFAAAMAMVLVGALTQASVASAAAPPKSAQGETGPAKTKNEAFPRPGHLNAITDVAGIQVGQYSRTDGDYQTGTTVVRAPDGAVNGVSVPGGWPGTINTDVLDPKKNPQLSDAVFLSGGSYYGLATFGGVMRWMEQHCEGLQVGPKRCDVDPLVSGAIVFDLGRGGDFDARPTADFGYRAADNTQPGRVAQGNVGAGTGTHSTPFKGGIGTASIEYKDGLTVGALIAVNAGTAVNPNNCGFYARYLGLGDEFKGLRLPTKRACRKAFATNASAGSKQPAHPHTAIAVVATNAGLSDAQTAQMASRGGDGEVIAIDTIHTLGDGDTIFALSTDKWKGSCDQTDCLERVYAGATKTIARAVVHALLNAKSTQGIVSYCDTFARACKHLAKS